MTPTRLVQFALLLSAFAAGPSIVRAQAPAKAPKAEADDPSKAIASLNEAFVKAFNEADAQGLAALMTENALMIDRDGTRTEGREPIAQRFAGFFDQSPGLSIVLKTTSLTFLAPDVAQEEGKAVVTSKAGALAHDVSTRYTVVYVNKEGKWLQASVKDEDDPELTPHDHLKALEWMLGDWVNENSDSVVNTHCEWVDGENFLLKTFNIQIEGKPALSGTQRIGWDSVARQVKSWVFDSEGGQGEGYWTREGDQWIIKAEGTVRDGKSVTATQIITYLNKDMMLWKSTDRTLGGEATTEAIDYVMVRKPPEPK